MTWTESHDRYTLKAAEWEWAFFHALLGVASLVVALQFYAPICGLLALVFVFLAVRSLPVAWIEVPLQGGEVRWGVGGRVETPEPVRVVRFEVDSVMRAMRHGDPSRYTVVAVLPDGSLHRVLGKWDCFPPTRAQALAAQLNGILGHEERPPMLDEASASRVSRERAAGGCLLVVLLILLVLLAFSRGF
ncbi:MAG: hypothetical protein AAB434_05240 [Planctomycetota bacterium]